MSVAKDNVYNSSDEALYKELSNVGFHLENTIGQKIIITDGSGFIQYPKIPLAIKDTDDSRISLPPHMKKNYQYSGSEKCLYYRIVYKNINAYFLIMDITVDQVPQILKALGNFKTFVTPINQAKKDMLIFEWQMYEYLFGQSKADLKDILRLVNNKLSFDCAYYVDIMVVREIRDKKQWAPIIAYAREYLKRVAPEAIMITDPEPGIATFILPAKSKTTGIEPFKIALEKKFQVSTAFGQSLPKPLRDLRKGCDEARIALYYPVIMETKTEFQCFSDLKYFTFLFSQELDTVKKFCSNTLSPLLDHDKKNNSSLLQTLAVLIKSNFNLKETAKSLFIHINTLYYRINKIEQILGIDMSLVNTRFNLFTVFKAWALLHISGLWDWSLGLQIDRFSWGEK